MYGQQQETARAYEEPFARQFSIFLANRVGQLKDLLDASAEEGLRLLGVSIVDSTDWAVLRIVFSDADRARGMLLRRAVPFTESQVLLIVLSGEGALRRISGHLVQAEINVHFAYPLTLLRDGNPVMVFHVDDPVLAGQLLMRHGFILLGQEDLAGPG
jgi:hypothetical protein